MVAGSVVVVDAYAMTPLVGGGAVQAECCLSATTIDLGLKRAIRVVAVGAKRQSTGMDISTPIGSLSSMQICSGRTLLSYRELTVDLSVQSTGPRRRFLVGGASLPASSTRAVILARR